MLQKILCLSIAGAAGTLLRYSLTTLIQRNIPSEFPLGTAVVNITGCLLFGLLWSISEYKFSTNPQLKALIFIGFFGAFTTFSSFIYENFRLITQSQYILAIANITLQNILGLTAVITGIKLGKLM